MKFATQRILAMLTFILVLGALGLFARHYGSLQWLSDNETKLRALVHQHPYQSWLLGFGIYTSFSLIPGTAGKSVVIGWLFGFWSAVLMVDLGLTIAACGGFTIARFIARDAVRSKFGDLIDKLDRGLEHDGAFYLLMMRLAHVPYSFVNYGAGATSVSLSKFCWTTAVGILPGTMIFVFVGTRIPTLAAIVEGGAGPLFDPLVVALLGGAVVFPLSIRWAVNRFYQQPGTPPEIDLAEISERKPAQWWPKRKDSNGNA